MRPSILNVVLIVTGLGVVTVAAVPGQSQSQAATGRAPAAAKPADLEAFLRSLPAATPPALDPPRALWLTAAPLGCIDELQPRPANRPYFWQGTFRTVDGYDKTRAFYGCRDWTSAAGAAWSLVVLGKRHPDLAVDGILREKLTDHLGKTNMEGELAYFKDSPNFQRPLGYAWFLKLYAELLTWKDPEAEAWAANAAPLARFLSEGMRTYLAELERPNRSASTANSAIALDLALDYVAVAHDSALERAIRDTARRFYAQDKNCATEDEAKTAEAISPCLSVATLMARVTDPSKYAAWLDTFLPEPPSEKFAPLTSVSFKIEPAGRRGGRAGGEAPAAAEAAGRGGEAAAPEGGGRGGRGGGAGTPHATWTTLTFTRADAFQRMALALPANDRRREAFRRLSAIHAQRGIDAMREPAIQDSPVPGTAALRYMASANLKGIDVVDLTVAAPKEAAAAKPVEYKDVDAFVKALPTTKIPTLDEPFGAGLAAMSLSCLGRPHARPGARAYLWETTYQPPDDFERNRAFYGCFDWHSAVNSTWALVKLLRMFPDNATAPIIRQKLNRHLGASNIEGEIAFFKTAGQFEVPYGYAWTLKLQGELMSWNDPDAAKWSASLAPLTKLFSERLVTYFKELERPVRTGVHPNSGFAFHLMYDYLTIAKDDALKAVMIESAKRFYGEDKNCQTANEPAPSDFLSPCLTEAAVMSRVLDRPAFVAWLDKFLPPLHAVEFRPLTEPLDPELITNPQRLAAKSHVIGLAFLRADAMNQIASALPANDARVPALRKLSAMHAARGLAATHVAGYYGSHFLSSMTILYFLSSGS